MFVFRPGLLDRRRTPTSRFVKAPEDPAARGALPARSGGALSQRAGDRRAARSSRSIQSVVDNVTLAHLDRRRHRAPERRADPDRRRRDDEVPARLRGGDPAHARRQHAAARRRCWRSSTARSACWPAPSARPARSASAGRSAATCSTSTGARRRACSAPARSLTMVLVGVIGVVASADVLRKKPLATLRAE